MRPWREFLVFSRLQERGEWQTRLEANLSHFQINYAALFILLMGLSLIRNPACVFLIVLLGAVWAVFLKKNHDPEWQVVVAGVSVNRSIRWIVLSVFTAIVFLWAVGDLLFSVSLVSALLVLFHGVCHPVPEKESGVL